MLFDVSPKDSIRRSACSSSGDGGSPWRKRLLCRSLRFSSKSTRPAYARLMSPVLGMPGQKFDDCPGEEVVAVTGDHMSGAADVDEVDVREAGDELVGPLLGDEIAHLAPHQKHGHVVAENRFDRRMHAVDLRHLNGGKRRGAVDEFRVPMPEPAIAATAQVGPKSVQVGGSAPVWVVFLDRVGDLVQRGESR